MSEVIEYCSVDRDDFNRDDFEKKDENCTVEDLRMSFEVSKLAVRPLPNFCRGGLII